ncbi:MAG TPA: FkbM family methyltransferase [Caldimonas sp.]|nr:FkbM family methyltransferase [Caldimonas sp.]
MGFAARTGAAEVPQSGDCIAEFDFTAMQELKARLVGTSVGLWLLGLRDKLSIVRAACCSPESVGTMANDHLAALLAVSICRPGHVFVDVGAHIGSIVASAKRRSRPSKILAIEAIPERAASLARRFPDVEVTQCAVGESEGSDVAFFVNAAQSGYSSLARGEGFREIRVPLRTLDGVLAGHDVDVIKIDIEGAELGALRGAVKTLSTHRPTVMFESAPGCGSRLGYGTTALWTFFDEAGYVVVAPNRLAHEGGAMSVEAFKDGHLYPRRTTNYFAVARERRDELRERARRVLGIRAESAPRSRVHDSGLAPLPDIVPHDA